jgi:hypothetical protein
MFCGDFCNAWAFDSRVWSPFRGCGASKRLSACGADFMSLKHHMHTQRCFGMAISMKAPWIGLFGRLHVTYDCACDAALEGQSPFSGTNIHMPFEVSDTFCWPPCPFSPGWRILKYSGHSMRFLYFCREIQDAKKSSTTGLSFSRLDISTSGTVNDANQHARIFSSSQCSGLDLSHHCRQE